MFGGSASNLELSAFKSVKLIAGNDLKQVKVEDEVEERKLKYETEEEKITIEVEKVAIEEEKFTLSPRLEESKVPSYLRPKDKEIREPLQLRDHVIR